MRRWRHKISFKYFWGNDSMTIEEKGTAAKKAVDRLICRVTFDDSDLEDISEDFADIRSVDDFDSVMDNLYDWADNNDVWVETF